MSMISSIKVLNFDKKNRKSFWVLPYACVSDTTHLDFLATIRFPILRVDFRFCFPKLISTAIRSISMARSIDVHQMIENQWGYALFHYALRIRRIAIFAGPDKFLRHFYNLASAARNRFFDIDLSMVVIPHRLRRYTMGDCYAAFALRLRWNVLTLRDIWKRNILAGAYVFLLLKFPPNGIWNSEIDTIDVSDSCICLNLWCFELFLSGTTDDP